MNSNYLPIEIMHPTYKEMRNIQTWRDSKQFEGSSQMIQLLQNLIGNAIKYSSEKSPQIHISSKKEDNNWLFSVKDNGIGIDPQSTERIFKIFQRLHTKNKFEGTGIGLAIAQKIVHRHGGEIWAESQPEKGSTFYFKLPI